MQSFEGKEFFKKVHPASPDFSFENEFHIRSLTLETAQPVSFKPGLFPRLPTNLDIMRFFLTLLKGLGQVPFCYDSTNGLYYFSWASIDTALSLAVALAATFGWFVYISHVVLKKFLVFDPWVRYTLTKVEEELELNSDLDERKVLANIMGLAVLNTCVALQQLVHVIFGWKNRHTFVTVMNNWMRIRWNLSTSLHSNDSRNAAGESSKYYLLVCFGVAYVLGISGPGLVIGSNAPCHADRVLEVIYVCWVFSYWSISESLQDVFHILMYHELSSNFKQIRQQIQLDMEVGNVSEERIRTWRRLILSIRTQTEAVSDYISTPQLCLLLQSIVLGTMAVFIAFVNGLGTDSAGIKPACLGIFVWLLSRLFCKTCMAERVTVEEALIKSVLLNGSIKGSVAMETEVQDLRSLLLSHPVQINLGNIVILRRQACLMVIGQIVTYLIVLVQFYNDV